MCRKSDFTAGLGCSVALYEIRTFTSRHTVSLVTMAIYANDMVAIVAAREFLRKGETVEVWRDDTLVYRTAPRLEYREPKRRRR
jgi:hypothetical protein